MGDRELRRCAVHTHAFPGFLGHPVTRKSGEKHLFASPRTGLMLVASGFF